MVLQEKDSFLPDIISQVRAPERLKMYVVDRKGQLLFDGRQEIDSITDISNLPAVRNVLAGQSGTISVTNSEGAEAHASYYPVAGIGWGVVVESPVSAIQAQLQGLVLALLLMSLSMFVISGYFAYRRSQLIYSLKSPAGNLKRRLRSAQSS
jgi:methyl-accepting chemotaxis protein